MDIPQRIPEKRGVISRVDEGPSQNPHLGLDRPYPNAPNYLISENDDKFRFMASLPGGLESMSAKVRGCKRSARILRAL